MAIVSQSQNVANSSTNSYPVGIFKQVSGTELQAVVLTDSAGHEFTTTNPFPFISGPGIPAWDYMSLATASTTDTYTFKTGGASGTTVATLLITYTDSTKATISTVVRS